VDDQRHNRNAGPLHPGFFGKVPTHGDFVSVGLPGALRSTVDQWIDNGLNLIKDSEDWEHRFHKMPSWRFVIQAPIWDDATIAGVLMPSRDRVGRSFPLVIAAQITDFVGNPQSLCFDRSWFMAAEALGETTRFKDFDLERFRNSLQRLRLPHQREDKSASGSDTPRSIWWNIDNDSGIAGGFMTIGKLEAETFEKLLPSTMITSAPRELYVPTPTPVPASQPKIRLSRSYATHAGTRLHNNSDSLLLSSHPDLFAVTDGFGNEQFSRHAARLATNTLAETQPCETHGDFIREIKGKLGKASSLLLSSISAAEREPTGASVAVLAFFRDTVTILWAGDARCYLIRDGMMRCLTTDHIEIGLKRHLSRFIGANQQFVPDTTSMPVEPGDRYVLCTSGLWESLGERSIADVLLNEELDSAADRLIQEALISNAKKNISVIVVDAGCINE